MKNQIAKDFLNTRNNKLVILSEIEKLQAHLILNRDLGNNTEVERLDNLLDEAFENMYTNQDNFENKYNIDYNLVEGDYLVDGVLPKDAKKVELVHFTKSERFAIVNAKNNVSIIREKGYIRVAQPKKVAENILKYTGLKVDIYGCSLTIN